MSASFTDLLLFPIHLFETSILEEELKPYLTDSKKVRIHLIEEPIYFGEHKLKMKFNKLKLVFHRASMKHYEAILTHIYGSNVHYHDYQEMKKTGYKFLSGAHQILAFDVVDFFLEEKLAKIKSSSSSKSSKSIITYLNSPSFLDTREDLEHFHTKINKSKTFYHATFYKWQKTHLKILEDEPSHDTENRNNIPASLKIPSLPTNDSKLHSDVIKEAQSYVERLFPDNYGNVENLVFPISHETSKKWLMHFCKARLHSFGKYEDAIDAKRNFLFHSCISPMLNVGLLIPKDVVSVVSTYYKKHSASIGIANYEGFIRQVIGWREYQRYIYRYGYEKITSSNHFGNDRTLNETWYNGTTGITPLDTVIKMAFDDGYIHHISRLMIVGNLMNLCGIKPVEAYKWFMEFSVDSYDWVMIGNVYSMALWCDGGLSMRKPYISGDGYIMKMGNFERGEWNDIWNAVFYHFIVRNKEKLKHTYYAGMIKNWEKKSKTEQTKMIELSSKVIANITR